MNLSINKDTKTSYDDGELILLNMINGNFYGLNDTGTVIWDLITKEKLSLNQVIQQISKSYEGTIIELEDDVNQFINNLIKYGLVEINE